MLLVSSVSPPQIPPFAGSASLPDGVRRTHKEGNVEPIRPQAQASKQAMLLVTRALERFALAAAQAGEDVAVVALFEHASYFAMERERYRHLAEVADVAVGFAGMLSDPPEGLTYLALPDDDPLAHEWTVLVSTSAGSGGLVSVDRTELSATAGLERARTFALELRTRPDWVAEQIARVLHDRADGPPATALQHLIGTATTNAERPATTTLQLLAAELERSWWQLVGLDERLLNVRRDADTDPLTGVFNRRYLERYLAHLGDRSPTLAAATFDLDGFKQLNDRWGHAAGDAALRTFAELLRRHCRPTDPVFRLGGDEWLVLYPDLSLAAITERAERILAELATLHLPRPAHRTQLRASAGVGVFPRGAIDLPALDEAMYAAKRAGTNRVEVATATEASA